MLDGVLVIPTCFSNEWNQANFSLLYLHVPATASSNAFELIAINKLNLDAPVRIITVYRPPVADSDPVDIDDMSILHDCLRHLCDIDFSVTVNGDFNLLNINWSSSVLDGLTVLP